MKKKSYLTATDQFCGTGGNSIDISNLGIVLAPQRDQVKQDENAGIPPVMNMIVERCRATL